MGLMMPKTCEKEGKTTWCCNRFARAGAQAAQRSQGYLPRGVSTKLETRGFKPGRNFADAREGEFYRGIERSVIGKSVFEMKQLP